jgi:hypothetical protein
LAVAGDRPVRLVAPSEEEDRAPAACSHRDVLALALRSSRRENGAKLALSLFSALAASSTSTRTTDTKQLLIATKIPTKKNWRICNVPALGKNIPTLR